MVRSRFRCPERSEKTLNPFYLWKNNYIKKLITTLELNGNIVKDPVKIAEAQSEFYQGLYFEKLNVQNYNYLNI